MIKRARNSWSVAGVVVDAASSIISHNSPMLSTPSTPWNDGWFIAKKAIRASTND